MKLLIVDGDTDMVEMLTSWLRTRGYQVKYALSAERIRSEWIDQKPDLVIVDTNLKGADALGLCRELRNVHDALILAIAGETDAGSQVRYLESGADAYLVKPFLPAQLLAYIHALSRRVRTTLLRNPSSIVTVGPLCVDATRNEVTVNGKLSRLTPIESKLLHLLAVNANDVCTLNQIVAHVWGYGDESDSTLIKAHIRHLREKIEPDPSSPRHIVTVPGSGYMLVRQIDQPGGVTTTGESAAPRSRESPHTATRLDTVVVLNHNQSQPIEEHALAEHVWRPPLHESSVTHENRHFAAE